MDLALTGEDRKFQQQVSEFLTENLPADISDRVRLGLSVDRAALKHWHAVLGRKGWLAPNWPKKYGGTGWTLRQRHLFDMACRMAHAPPSMAFNFNMLGPALIAFGSETQKAHFLPRILQGVDWWCQGYSEPEAGSDLASLKTEALRDGADYIVNGSKIWTSGAEEANHIFCLVRTNKDGKQQEGISFLLIDMQTPGIDVQPLIALNGRRLWNQVIFDNVRVPVENLLGGENNGWTVAKKLLGDERFFVSRVSECRRMLSVVRDAAQEANIDDTADFRQHLGAMAIRVDALEQTSLRMLAMAEAGGRVGAEPSMLKLLGSHLVQDIDELLMRCFTYYGMADHRGYLFNGANRMPVGPDFALAATSNYLHHRGYTIAGGSSEIQRGILAKLQLGL